MYNPERIYVKNVSLKDGISQCVITDLVQDKLGFFWFTTYDGLNRYDGQNLKIYRHNPDDSLSLPSSKLYHITCDESNHLYLQTSHGFAIFDCATDRCIYPRSLLNYQIQWLTQLNHADMWAYDRVRGLFHFDPQHFSPVSIPSSSDYKLQYPIMDMYARDNCIYMISDHGEVMWYSLKEHRFHYSRMHGSPLLFLGSGLDKEGNILLGSKDSDLICFQVNSRTFIHSDLSMEPDLLKQVNDIHYDPAQDILYLSCYGKGLFVYDYRAKRMEHYGKKDARLNLTSNFSTSLFLSGNGTLAIGYDGLGVDLLDNHIRQFTPITYEGKDDQTSLRFVRRIVEQDDQQLLIGTSGSGLVKYNRKEGSFYFYNMNNTAHLPDYFIMEMMRYKDELWLGFNGGGLGIMDRHRFTIKKRITAGNGMNQISDGSIWAMTLDSSHHIWLGTKENGMNRVNPETGEVKQYTKDKYSLFRNNSIRCLYPLKEDKLLIGSERGLLQFSIASETLKKLFPMKDREVLSFSAIKCIIKDKKGRLWLGTDGGGIVVLDSAYQLIRNFNASNSLNSGVIYCLLPQNDSTFWFSSNNGIGRLVWNESSLLPKGSIDIGHYEEMNGLQGREFNTNAFAQLSDGSMVFGGLNGINIFNPKEITTNYTLPNVYISDFRVFDNDLPVGHNISYMKEVYLKPNQNSISITFNSLGFVLPEKTKYRYRLIGYNEEWIQSGTRNYISYTNLPPGGYEFQVMVCNYDGIWNNRYTSLMIHIATPFYKTWWFILLNTVLISGTVYFLYQYRIKQIKEKEQLRIQYNMELAEVEMKALRAQINPHFLFNSLNSINNYILKNDTDKASRYLIKFSQLVRNILNHSSNSYITLEEELQTIELYLQIEGMRFSKQFSYRIERNEGIHSANIIIPSLLLQPYVENAIWHGLLHKEGEKNITIVIEMDRMKQAVVVSIIDNGVGRTMAKEISKQPDDRKSYGMKLGEDRLKLMNQLRYKSAVVEVIDLYDVFGKASGTHIRIRIPTTQNT